MTTAILNDNFSASQGLNRQKSDAVGNRHGAPEANRDLSARPTAEQTDIGRAQRHLTQENTESAATTIGSADEAQLRAAFIRQMLTDSPASALKAHAAVDGEAVEAAMRRPNI